MQEPSQSERVQRVRIGLSGLAVVFLLVLLGTAISRSSDPPPLEPVSANGLANEVAPDEPLAEIGVAPGQLSTADSESDASRTP